MAEPNPSAPRLVRAWFDTLSSGIVEFERNWNQGSPPILTLSGGSPAVSDFRPAPAIACGRSLGYVVHPPGILSFVLPLGPGCPVEPDRDQVFIAGDFNGWQAAVGLAEWVLRPDELDGEPVMLWTGPADRVLGRGPQRFKFVTGENIWLGVPDDAVNSDRDEHGAVNRLFQPERTGLHLWRFTLAAAVDLAGAWTIAAGAEAGGPALAITPGNFFYNLGTDLPLGARVADETTTFRLFAPRASSVTVFACDDLAAKPKASSFPLARRKDEHGPAGVWELTVDRNLHGWYYWYSIDGVRDGPGKFDPTVEVLDPYASATVDRGGPGIILDSRQVARGDASFATPAWQDLVIAEAHLRDLTAQAPVRATPEERRGFTGLRRWVESPEFYLHHLGVNCVELQPVQEFDNRTVEEYHWGYMTNNYFAPESSYSLDPARASGVRELQELVAAFHRRGIAVILDVVYNHVGEPAHLMFIDRVYYFEQDAAGKLANWSGCGNDVRASSAMSRRLIIDSLIHLIEVYGVDGFRFDLAELLGIEVLRAVESALKRVKPDVVLIAEPWSFRGHIAGALRGTGYASWNDGYRDTLRGYVRGEVPAGRMEYFIRGSPWYFAKWPAQTVNYTESHDDRTFIDAITENPGFDGFNPTANDIRRTHLMAAVLLVSVGIPMLAAGQDFLRSKRGVSNSYQRGDLNALDYRRMYDHLGTHAYFADWIAFRLSARGRLLRHFSRPTEGFFRFFRSGEAPPLAVLFNADFSQGSERLLFAVNPTTSEAVIGVGGDVAAGPWRPLADRDRFFPPDSRSAAHLVESDLRLPGLGCALWISETRGS